MKVQLNSHVDADLQRRLKGYAARTGQRLQDVVAEAINGYLASKEAAAGETLQSANERDPGAVTPGSQLVMARAGSETAPGGTAPGAS